MLSNTVLILTEAGPQFGIGHWRRCQALATAFEQQGSQVELRQNEFTLPVKPVDILVIDSYHLTLAEYRQFKEVTKCLVVIDDNNRLPYPAEIVINPSLGAEKISYPSGQLILAGATYALLHPLYAEAQAILLKPVINKVFLTLGGSAAGSLTTTLAEQLQPSFPETEFMTTNGQLSPEQMFERYHQVDVVISGGGQTLHELACIGMPTLAIELADNQRWNLAAWHQTGFIPQAQTLTDPQLSQKLAQELEAMTPAKRQQLAAAGRKQIDGLGAQRVVELILTHANH